MSALRQDSENILTELSVGVGVLIENAQKLGNDSHLVADDVRQLRGDLQEMERSMDAKQVPRWEERGIEG